MGERVLRNLFDDFGVLDFHEKGILGQDTSILVIDNATDSDHGEVVSFIISPKNNTDGFIGIAPLTKLEFINVNASTKIPIDRLINAIQKGIDKDVDIISISLGTSDNYTPLENIIQEAIKKGILIFAAAGNSGEMGYEFPAACQSVISVGSIDTARQLSNFNTRNDAVAVFAPGERITINNKEYTGTSFSTPFAAGLACLILSQGRLVDETKKFTRKEMVSLLRDTLKLNCEDHVYKHEGSGCSMTSITNPLIKKPVSSIYVILLCLCISYIFILNL